MRRVLSLAAVSGLVLFGASAAMADAPTPIAPAGKPLGVIPVRGQASRTAGTTGNLLYHAGGSVVTGAAQQQYAIYWGNNFSYNGSTTYQSIINGYFGNVAADSGKSSNVYYSDTQYSQSGGLYAQYSQTSAGTWSDTSTPAAGCNSTAGGSTTCVTDAQIQAEVQKAIAANPGWPASGMNAEYFVFLANGWSTCSGSSCFVSQFCAYHSHLDISGQHVLYANMPFTGYQLGSCSGASGSPNNNAAADATLSTVSHESNETITDPLGNAWYDRRGNENGDKCAYNYGTRLGTVNGGDYNQAIGTGTYELQQEWSNKSSGCVLTGQ